MEVFTLPRTMVGGSVTPCTTGCRDDNSPPNEARRGKPLGLMLSVRFTVSA